MCRWWRLVAAFLLAGLAGCATQSYRTIDVLPRGAAAPRILVMPPDIELSELTAGGSVEMNAEWTRAAERHLKTAIREHLQRIHASFVEYRAPADDAPEAEILDQLQPLHATVGQSILAFHFEPQKRLPSKKDKFDWSLGPAVTHLAGHADADYALFVWVRDSYSSPARVALQFVAAMAGGIPVGGGVQTGLCSLVDLKTGQVVWFNALKPREEGDMRELEATRRTTAFLLDRMPK